MYSFEDGKIQLDRVNGEYIVLVDGEPISPPKGLNENQLRNPVLAVNRFISAASEYLKRNVKRYQSDNELNPIMGCNINMDCASCRFYGLDDEASNCITGGRKCRESPYTQIERSIESSQNNFRKCDTDTV